MPSARSKFTGRTRRCSTGWGRWPDASGAIVTPRGDEMGSRNQAFLWCLAPGVGTKGAVGMTFFRLSTIGLALVVVTTSLACAAERDRMKLQQPLVPTPKLYCYSANCMSLSSTVLVSDACWRTCAAQCGGHFQTCFGAAVLNNCRFVGDVCDLSCQKRCRAYGGPLLDITGLLSGFTD